MPIFATAYDTTVGRGLDNSKAYGALQKALLTENFALVNNQTPGIDMPVYATGLTPSIVTTQTESEMEVPMFAHPILVDLSMVRRSASETYIVSDTRAFLTNTPRDDKGQFKAKNKSEFDFTVNRTILSSHWYKGEHNSFKYLSSALSGMYASWVSEAVARRYGLDAGDQQVIAALAAYFYYNLYNDHKQTEENEKIKLAPLISKATYMEVEQVLGILDAINVAQNISDLCEQIKSQVHNPRLDDFNSGILVTIIMTTWYGTNGKEIATVALEHIPTFIMLVFAAFTERSYKHAAFTKIIERYQGRKGEDEFVRSLKVLMRNLKEQE